jgi:RNA polymerase sigma-70 factor (ECF subfamily)
LNQSTQKLADSETILLRDAQRGSERAFIEIVRRYEQTVYSFAFKVCRDKEKAAETLQDTFVNLYRKLDQFDHKSKFTTWLYSIVANNCLMKRRRTKLDEAAISFEELDAKYKEHAHGRSKQIVPTWKSTPLDRVMNHELRGLLDEAIQKLPLDYRAVFILRDVEGQSAEETAKILKLSVPAVKSRLHRARVFLREQLNEYMAS